jgi:hypothetical protein
VKILGLIKTAFLAFIAWARLKTEQAKGEKEKRENAEHEAAVREEMEKAAVNSPDTAAGVADRLRDRNRSV